MNLNQENFPADLPHAISLKQITASSYDPVQVARELVPAIQHRINTLKKIRADSGQTTISIFIRKINPLHSGKNSESDHLQPFMGVDAGGILLTSQGSFAWEMLNGSFIEAISCIVIYLTKCNAKDTRHSPLHLPHRFSVHVSR